jgi:arylsulfatase A-like enzyme
MTLQVKLSLLLVCTFVSPGTSAYKKGQGGGPNVLLIGVESLRADHVGCLGYFRDTTPTLDRLATEGVVFNRAMATSSWTIPAVMSVMTSLYPGLHNAKDFRQKTPEEITTLAEILKERGYVTVAFAGNPLLDGSYGFRQGFDLYDDFTVQLHLGLDLFEEGGEITLDTVHDAVTNQAIHRAATSWLKANHGERFFMFVFYFDPHIDYIPPPPFDRKFDPDYEGAIDGKGLASEPLRSTRPPQRDLDHIIALYDGELLHTDGYISKLLDEFRKLGIWDDTLVVVFGDHGEEFYEHGSTVHGLTLYNEVLRIPLILRRPSVIPGNKKVGTLVNGVDIMPTILDYLDIKYNGFMQGGSLRPLIEGKRSMLHDVVYAELNISPRDSSAAISRDEKIILDLHSGARQIFDLNNDPCERDNLYNEQLPLKEFAIESNLWSWLANNEKMSSQLFKDKDDLKIKIDESRVAGLRSLGYLQ